MSYRLHGTTTWLRQLTHSIDLTILRNFDKAYDSQHTPQQVGRSVTKLQQYCTTPASNQQLFNRPSSKQQLCTNQPSGLSIRIPLHQPAFWPVHPYPSAPTSLLACPSVLPDCLSGRPMHMRPHQSAPSPPTALMLPLMWAPHSACARLLLPALGSRRARRILPVLRP
jgi:hypothetical protein